MELSKINPLNDKDFLKRLDTVNEREIYAKIISLDWEENQLEEIQGRVVSGSVNIDGTSAVRRTCSASLVAKELNIHDYYWGLNTKFKMEIGLRNRIEPKYKDIIWFPMGTYVISSFNTSQTTNNYTINIQGKDKMTLLNGEVGGLITSLTWDFGTYDEVMPDGTISNRRILLKDIIIEAVHEFAKEPYYNIIVNDLDNFGVELMEYRGNDPMFLIVNQNTLEVSNMSTDVNIQYDFYKREKDDNWKAGPIKISKFFKDEENGITFDGVPDEPYDTGVDRLTVDTNRIFVASSANPTEYYSIMRAKYGTVVGYRITDLVFAGDLIGQIGNPITTAVLDRIKNMLGEFEYFYDLDGRFIFQKKPTYISSSYSGAESNDDKETWFTPVAESSPITYYFEDSQIITSFSNSPQLANLKNDFSIWGTKKGVSGNEIPVHMRYAIDHKPKYYTTLEGITYTTRTEEEVEEDRKNFEHELSKGYQKEPSKFGLSEDWWEVRDWAKAWLYSNLPVPTNVLSFYCPKQAYIVLTDTDIENYPKLDEDEEYSFVTSETWESWHIKDTLLTRRAVDNIIFTDIGRYWDTHGRCMHSYTQWLDYFKEGGKYSGGYAYFYKPQVPEDDPSLGGGQLIIGENIEYECDWRELIYQMAKDHMEHGHQDDFEILVGEKNKNFYPTGITGYEQYYTDIISFWRQIYDPTYLSNFEQIYLTKNTFLKNPTKYYKAIRCTPDDKFKKDYVYLKKLGFNGSTYDVVEMTSNIWNNKLLPKERSYYYYLKQCLRGDLYDSKADYFVEKKDNYVSDEESPIKGWSKEVVSYPEMLNFWFDFLDSSDGELDKYSVPNVGIRPKAENDTSVKAIYFRDTPNVIFVDITKMSREEKQKLIDKYGSEAMWLAEIEQNLTLEEKTEHADDLYKYLELKQDIEIKQAVEEAIKFQKEEMSGYTFIRLPNYMENLFSISAQGKSAFDKLDNWLYNYTYCTETVSISALPVYYLSPNTRIFIKDENSGIEGEYIINRISLPLNYNGMMSLSATKAVERIY